MKPQSAPDPHEREQALFLLALGKVPAERSAWLDHECGGNSELRTRLEQLLKAHEEPDSKFDSPNEAIKATILVDLPKDPLDEASGQRVGRYKLLEKIGEGGCGVVYVAEQIEPVRRRVALKVIKLGMDTKAVVARFEAERQALAMMDHPNIAKVLDAGSTETGRPYFVMELVRGIRITDYCDENRLQTTGRLDLFMRVCQAIQHAHQKGIIHRDIKPSNILVTLHDGVPIPKVIDFGIAKATEGRLTDKTVYTQLHQFIGTPAYMSPEQAEMSGLDIDTRSDIYSLGVLLYELLTCHTPFDAKELLKDGLDAIRRRIREVDPPRPSTRLSTLKGEALTITAKRHGTDGIRLVYSVRGDLDWIVMKCLEKDRTRRYEAASGLALDIKRYLDSEPIVARPPSTGYRIQKMVRRNKVAFAAAGAVTAALISGFVATAWSLLSERQAHAAEAAARVTADTQRRRAEAGEIEAKRLLYLADMNVAQLAWQQSNFDRLRDLIAETRGFPGRGFEWYYWLRQSHLWSTSFNGHTDGVKSAAFYPDGRRVVTASADKTAKVWDSVTGKTLLTLTGHLSNVVFVAVSPEGSRVATSSTDRTVKLWDATDGRQLVTIPVAGQACESVAFSPDGRRLATAEHDDTLKIWEVASGKQLQALKVADSEIWCVAFSPDGRSVATGSETGVLQVSDALTGQRLFRTNGQDGIIFSTEFSRDGKRIVTGNFDGTATIWDAQSGREILTLKGHAGFTQSASFSPDGRRVVTASWDRTAKVWDAEMGTEQMTIKGHTAAVHCAAFSPDGRQVVTASDDSTAKVWETPSNFLALETSGRPRALLGHTGYVLRAAFSPDGTKCATASMDQTAKIWQMSDATELVTLKGHTEGVSAISFSPDNRRVVTGSYDHTAKVWDAATGNEIFTLKGHNGVVWASKYSLDGSRIATGSDDRTVRLWDAARGDQLLVLIGHDDTVRSVAFSPDGQRLASAGCDNLLKVWETGTGRQLLSLKAQVRGIGAQAVAFSPDGSRLLCGGYDNTATLWDSATGEKLATLKENGAPIMSVNFSPDGQRLLTGSFDGSVKVWDAESGQELLSLREQKAFAHGVTFSADGRRILSGSSDATICEWLTASREDALKWQPQTP